MSVAKLEVPRSARLPSRARMEKHQILSHEEVVDLSKKIALNDSSALETLMLHNQRLVIMVAQRYANLGLHFDDLFQEGMMGLMRASKDFDPEFGAEFSTYAIHWIQNSIRFYVQGNIGQIRKPKYISYAIFNIDKAAAELTRGQMQPSDRNIALKLGCPLVQLRRVKALARKVETVSLHAPATSDTSVDLPDELIERICAPVPTPLQVLEAKDALYEVGKILESVLMKIHQVRRLRSAEIFAFHYQLNDEWSPRTFRETGEKFDDVSRQAIHQNLSDTWKKLGEHISGMSEGYFLSVIARVPALETLAQLEAPFTLTFPWLERS